MTETALKLYPNNWTNTKVAINNAIQKAEQIDLGNTVAFQQIVLETINEIKYINTILEHNYWENPNTESDEELDTLNKLGLNAERLSKTFETNTNTQISLGHLAFQLEILADLILSIVNGQKITDLVREIRGQHFTPEEESEVNRIFMRILNVFYKIV